MQAQRAFVSEQPRVYSPTKYITHGALNGLSVATLQTLECQLENLCEDIMRSQLVVELVAQSKYRSCTGHAHVWKHVNGS